MIPSDGATFLIWFTRIDKFALTFVESGITLGSDCNALSWEKYNWGLNSSDLSLVLFYAFSVTPTIGWLATRRFLLTIAHWECLRNIVFLTIFATLPYTFFIASGDDLKLKFEYRSSLFFYFLTEGWFWIVLDMWELSSFCSGTTEHLILLLLDFSLRFGLFYILSALRARIISFGTEAPVKVTLSFTLIFFCLKLL